MPILFSVTAKDCEWDYIRGSGKGGQKKNKTSSAVRCRHKPSGAIGYAEDSRSQIHNKRKAFIRMAESKEFKRWHRIEIARRTGVLMEEEKIAQKISQKIDRELNDPQVTKVEIKRDGRWESESQNIG